MDNPGTLTKGKNGIWVKNKLQYSVGLVWKSNLFNLSLQYCVYGDSNCNFIMRSKNKEIYSILVFGDKTLADDMSDCLTVSCTNMISLEKITGIKRDRLVYVFTKLKRNVLVEAGNLIIKSSQLYIGDQKGGLKRKGYTGFNRNV